MPTWRRVMPRARRVASSRRVRSTLATSACATASTPSAATKPPSTNGSEPISRSRSTVDGGAASLELETELLRQRGGGPLHVHARGEAHEHVPLLQLLSSTIGEGWDRRSTASSIWSVP